MARILPLAVVLLFSIAASARPPDMVQIEVEVFEVVHESGQDLGISWNWANTGPNGNLKDSFARFPVSLNERGQVTLEVLDTRFGVLTASIAAAMRRGNAKLLSRPTLVTLDGKKALITSGEEFPFNDFKKSVNSQQYVVAFKNTGVNLEVTPDIVRHASYEDRIRLSVSTSVSELSRFERFENDSGVWELPVISTRSANTPLLVNDRSTIVMGGLLEQRHRTTERGIPYLSAIPGLGAAFRSKSEKDLESEVIIFLTPTILRPGVVTLPDRSERIVQVVGEDVVEMTANGTGAPRPEPEPEIETPAVEEALPAAPERVEEGLVVAGLAHDVRLDRDGLEGELTVTGRIKNRNRRAVDDPEVEVTIIDRDGSIYDTQTVGLRKLKSGQDRTFKVTFKDFDGAFLESFDRRQIQIRPLQR